MSLLNSLASMGKLLQLCTPSGLVHEYYDKTLASIFREEPSVSCEAIGSHLGSDGRVGELFDYLATRHGGSWAKASSQGSTTNMLAVLRFLARRGVNRVAIPEFSHVCIWRGIQMNKLKYALIPCADLPGFNAVLPPTVESLQENLSTDVEAVILTSPVYDLVYAPIKVWREVIEDKGREILLVVDAAWSRTPYTEKLIPRDGAHIIVNSTHKLMGALQGASIIIASEELSRRDIELLEDSWRTYHSTSPSFPVLASIELTYLLLHREQGLLELPSRFSTSLKTELESSGFTSIGSEHIKEVYPDPFFIEDWKIHTALPVAGYHVKRKLEEDFGVVAEKAGPTDIQFLSTFRAVLRHRNNLNRLAKQVAQCLEQAVTAVGERKNG